MAKQMWTQEEVEALRRMYPDIRISPQEMEGRFGRSLSAIVTKAYSLGIRRSDRIFRTWTDDEVTRLTSLYPDPRISSQHMEQCLGRSWVSIAAKARDLGFSRPHTGIHAWDEQEIIALKDMYSNQRISPEQMEEYFGRSYRSISSKAWQLGLKRSTGGVLAWCDEEIADLKRMYPDLRHTKKQLEEYFGRSWTAIRIRGLQLGLRRPRQDSWTEDEVADLHHMYPDTSVASEQLVAHFGRSLKAIHTAARELDLSRYNSQVNHAYFREINTHEQAYWLGFLAADGCVYLTRSGSYSIRFSLQIGDEHVVRRFAATVAPGAKPKRDRNQVCVAFNSNEMAQDLARYGIVPNKSLILRWPDALPEIYAPTFILGYFDGDGCLCQAKQGNKKYWHWSVSGTQFFLSKIHQYIQCHSQIRLSEPTRAHKDRSPKLYVLRTAHQEYIRQIDAMLNVSRLGLHRKHFTSQNE